MSGLQMDRSVSVSVGVVFGVALPPPPLSSGMEDESPLRLGSTPGTQKLSAFTGLTAFIELLYFTSLTIIMYKCIKHITW